MANANNVVLFDPHQRPEYALARQEKSALTKSLVGGSGFPGKRISIKGGVFRLIADGKEVASIEERYLDVVFVRSAEHVGRMYFDQPYSDEAPISPACWSSDGVKPEEDVANKQSPQCATCPQNVKGSGNDDTRACRFSQRVAVQLANDIEGDTLQLVVPAASLFGKPEGDNMPLQAYARKLDAANINIEQVITRLKFDTSASSPKLFFKGMRWLTEEEYAIAQAKGQTAEAISACKMSVAVIKNDTQPLALPGKQPAGAAPQLPASEEEAPAPAPKRGRGRPPGSGKKVEEAPAPEPTVRANGTQEPELPKKSPAAELAAAWDTDD